MSKIFKTVTTVVIGFTGMFALSGCSVIDEFVGTELVYSSLTDGEKNFVDFPEDLLGDKGYSDAQKKAYTAAKMDELKEMSAADRALLPTKEQEEANEEANKERLTKIAKETANEIN